MPEIPFALPRVTATQRARAAGIMVELARLHPDAKCALHYSAPHELLIATILSAQAQDATVNKATPALFRAFPKPADYARATPAEIEPYIRTIGLYRNKARAVHEAMKSVVEDFGGEVPRTMEELLTLRGVARKTANVVLGNAFGINAGFVVDTHIHRLALKYGLAPKGSTVAATERYLMALVPREDWTIATHRIIAHGRTFSPARGGDDAKDPVWVKFCAGTRAASAKPGEKTPAAKKGAKQSAKKSAKKATKKKPAPRRKIT
jgi:endonuclease-3